MLIYRIEHPESGKGPWSHTGMLDTLRCVQEVGREMPSPITDLVGLRRFDCHVCGCASLYQLGMWFNHTTLFTLFQHGYHLLCYSIPARLVRFGTYQVVFKKEHATPIKRIK